MIEGTLIMKCMKCGATAQKGFTTNVTDLQDCLIIVRNVPCFKCLECNEIIYTGDVIQQLEEIIDSAKKLCRKFLLLIIQKLPDLLIWVASAQSCAHLLPDPLHYDKLPPAMLLFFPSAVSSTSTRLSSAPGKAVCL